MAYIEIDSLIETDIFTNRICQNVSSFGFNKVADSVFWFVKKNVFLYIISEHLCNAAAVGTDSQTIYEK